MIKKKNFIVLAVLLFIFAGCGAKTNSVDEAASDAESIKVVTTFYPMYDFSKQVAGDKATVDILVPNGTEPHDYEPSAKDIAKIQEADVFVYNSEEMETWVTSVLKNIDTSKVKVVKASESIELLSSSEEEHEEEEETDHSREEEADSSDSTEEEHSHDLDPHVWLSPVLAQVEVKNIQKGLSEVDPDNKDVYETNSDNFVKELEELNTKFEEAFSGATQRTFVTQHQAFAYLALQYDLVQEAISGISPDQEPSAKKLAEIEQFVKDNDVKIIFTEELASQKVAETISSATGAKLEVLSPLEGLSDEDQKSGLDYIGVMTENLEKLKQVIK